jgi:hypothetical protein
MSKSNDMPTEVSIQSVMKRIPGCTREQAIERLEYERDHKYSFGGNRSENSHLIQRGKVGPGPNCYGPMF